MPESNGPGGRPASPAERLDSWKEIAAYLRREVRTVQRWESERGLPVHRHSHGERATVYAFREELDRWWLQGGEKLQRYPNRFILVPLGILSLLVLGAALYHVLTKDRAPSRPREAVLAVFEDETHTAEPSARAFRAALERELSRDGSLELASGPRIGDALERMRLERDAVLDASIGRELCLRDGGLRALVIGRSRRVGSKRIVTVELVAPASASTLASESWEIGGPTQHWEVLEDSARWVRQELGRSLPAVPSLQRLEKVTTSSLEALELYTRAYELASRSEWGASEQLVRQAITLDPRFASAHNWLGWCLLNQGIDGAPLEAFARAVELSSSISAEERYFLLGSHHSAAGDRARAVADYEALLEIDPEHYWGTNNLAFLYADLGDYPKAAAWMSRLADSRVDDFRLQARAAEAQAVWVGDRKRAEIHWERARRLLSPETISARPLESSWIELYPAFSQWSAGKLEDARATTDLASARVRDGGPGARSYYARAVGESYLALLRFDEAESFFEQIPSRELRSLHLSTLALARGDPTALERCAREYADSFTGWGIPLGGQILVRAGLLQEAEEVLHYGRREKFQPWKLKLMEGEIALARNELETASAALQEVVSSKEASGTAAYFLGAESLARTWLDLGRLDRALAVLEASAEQRDRAYAMSVNSGGFSGFFWLRNLTMQAALYRRAGRVGEAAQVEESLRRYKNFAAEGFSRVDRNLARVDAPH